MSLLRVSKLSKDYGHERGIYDLTFQVEKGEAFGLMGPVGSGKTTAMKILMGFMRQDQGRCAIAGRDCYKRSEEIKKVVGYLPEDPKFADDMTGLSMIKFQAELRRKKGLERAFLLSDRLGINLHQKIETMTADIKQKLAVICALWYDPPVYFLDQPMRRLDRVGQNRLIELLLEEKERGKTILIASHAFEDLERICDRVAVLKEGRMIALKEIGDLRYSKRKAHVIVFQTEQEAIRFSKQEEFFVSNLEGCRLTVSMDGEMKPLLKRLLDYQVDTIEPQIRDLEEAFIYYYGGGKLD
ncbi:MAG: ABC transporter ATP-binding protein [Eubacteriales bacterium]|nr:ABC transporter ATP-binding protein [Eubacteriales bacterium]